jgi:coiled-coil domain-containing protein 130
MQGFNMGRYYPPDAENPPTFNAGKHPLGARAHKAKAGILVVRFELPFAVWCTTCQPEAIIGQGVRFNAEKSHVGNFHSTKIWNFRIKHSACGGFLDIRTDPEHTEYVVASGGRRRDYGPDDPLNDGELAFLTPEERERRRDDAFAALEAKVADKKFLDDKRQRLADLQAQQDKTWADPYTMNQKLRKTFREGRKERERVVAEKKDLQDRFGLDMEIADTQEGDAIRAVMVDFKPKDRLDDLVGAPMLPEKTVNVGVYRPRSRSPSGRKLLRREVKREEAKRDITQRFANNFRAKIDPFGSNYVKPPKPVLPFLKRKRDSGVDENAGDQKLVKVDGDEKGKAPVKEESKPKNSGLECLVADYGSDSD